MIPKKQASAFLAELAELCNKHKIMVDLCYDYLVLEAMPNKTINFAAETKHLTPYGEQVTFYPVTIKSVPSPQSKPARARRVLIVASDCDRRAPNCYLTCPDSERCIPF